MKKDTEQYLLIGGGLLAAYFLFFKKTATTTTPTLVLPGSTSQALPAASTSPVAQVSSAVPALSSLFNSIFGSSTTQAPAGTAALTPTLATNTTPDTSLNIPDANSGFTDGISDCSILDPACSGTAFLSGIGCFTPDQKIMGLMNF